ncbi:hypothetical protein ACN1TK_002344 [Vibrio cholerae]
MHKLQNGSQVSERPQRKPLVGLGGYFSESNDQGAPSYPGQDWFNDCTDEFINALDEMGITYDQEQLDHLARAFAAVRSQEWNANVNYGIGQEVVRNNLRYIARAASGPDNGGAITPENNSGSTWDLVLPKAYSTTDTSNKWIKIAEIIKTSSVFEYLNLEVIGASDRAGQSRFSADVYISEQSASISVSVIPKSLGLLNPEIYIRTPEVGVYELWILTKTSVASPLTIMQKSRSLRVSTLVGVLNITNTVPTGTTLVPYDTGYQFASIPIGMEVAFDTPPPTNDPRFRFVKLTHNDAYNTGLLTSQTLSGSAPELVSTAVISAAQSPINGQTIDMINTMGTFIRPGVAAGVRQLSENRSHAHALGVADSPAPGGGSAAEGFGPIDSFPLTNADGGSESRPYNISRVFYKRIY